MSGIVKPGIFAMLYEVPFNLYSFNGLLLIAGNKSPRSLPTQAAGNRYRYKVRHSWYYNIRPVEKSPYQQDEPGIP